MTKTNEVLYHVQCAWCGRHLGCKWGAVPEDWHWDEDGPPISHGICGDCREELLASAEGLAIRMD